MSKDGCVGKINFTVREDGPDMEGLLRSTPWQLWEVTLIAIGKRFWLTWEAAWAWGLGIWSIGTAWGMRKNLGVRSKARRWRAGCPAQDSPSVGDVVRSKLALERMCIFGSMPDASGLPGSRIILSANRARPGCRVLNLSARRARNAHRRRRTPSEGSGMRQRVARRINETEVVRLSWTICMWPRQPASLPESARREDEKKQSTSMRCGSSLAQRRFAQRRALRASLISVLRRSLAGEKDGREERVVEHRGGFWTKMT
ncbi:hypothetical protein B0H17DRAFT_1186190 [Mycena rosella]|uniref:Uncharacterized protein n=1 Tax=Mycena rosella TaxID=1033263 RepID=A0AAD7G0Z3_MYCRO|nr:hypothetical protein B0H17DRAFT_1186190 [Mycena rosella]